ncbi:unnamed protein product [Effrenium voratum]|nr:unnamed protein product [Effrenium voratum]
MRAIEWTVPVGRGAVCPSKVPVLRNSRTIWSHALGMGTSANHFVLAIERAGRYLSEAEANAIAGHGYAFLNFFKALARLSLRQGKLRWVVIPKCHALTHQIQEMISFRLNCRFEYTMADEDDAIQT